jgi:hypothetical protein
VTLEAGPTPDTHAVCLHFCHKPPVHHSLTHSLSLPLSHFFPADCQAVEGHNPRVQGTLGEKDGCHSLSSSSWLLSSLSVAPPSPPSECLLGVRTWRRRWVLCTEPQHAVECLVVQGAHAASRASSGRRRAHALLLARRKSRRCVTQRQQRQQQLASRCDWCLSRCVLLGCSCLKLTSAAQLPAYASMPQCCGRLVRPCFGLLCVCAVIVLCIGAVHWVAPLTVLSWCCCCW